MKKAKPAYACNECGWQTSKWVGRCTECQQWGTVAELGATKLRDITPGPVSAPARPIADVTTQPASAESSGFAELDRVLGGGFVSGSVVLVSGEPGVGKSTLLLDVAARAAASGPVLYVTGEESTSQVRLRADRINALSPQLLLAAETDLSAILGHIETVSPKMIVVDSVQTIGTSAADGTPGGIAQVREVAGALIRTAKSRGITTILVGHVTKDGAVAGPRTLEHLVDVVVYVEGDRHARLRLVRAQKNRFGPADEVGCFDLGEGGIQELADPSELFMTRRTQDVAGSCLTVAMEGTRPLVAEVQALVNMVGPGNVKRSTSGLDSSRLSMILAVLDRRAGIRTATAEVYAATVGGVRLSEPSADIAVALAVASACNNVAIRRDIVAVGEVGLSGELRRTTGIKRRLSEAARLGFNSAIVPVDSGPYPHGIRVIEVADLRSAIAVLKLNVTNKRDPSLRQISLVTN